MWNPSAACHREQSQLAIAHTTLEMIQHQLRGPALHPHRAGRWSVPKPVAQGPETVFRDRQVSTSSRCSLKPQQVHDVVQVEDIDVIAVDMQKDLAQNALVLGSVCAESG